MATKNAPYYSCKFNRPDTIKSHKTKDSAIKSAGNFGMIFDTQDSTEKLVLLMATNKLHAFSPGTTHYQAMNFSMEDNLIKLGLIEKS